MTTHFDLHITSALPVGDLVARLSLRGGESVRIVLREGRYQGALPDVPLRLQLTAEEAPAGTAELRTPTESEAATAEPEGTAVAYEELFENGIELTGATVRLQLVWGLHCHQGSTLAPSTARGLGPVGRERFVAWEHLQCAADVGRDRDGRPLELGDGPLGLTASTPLTVRKGALTLSFGQIIALAGDYYAYFDGQARTDCGAAWPPASGLLKLAGDYTSPTLAEEDPTVVADILAAAMRDRDQDRDKLTEASLLAKDGLFGRYPVRRYLALASQNYCHFAALPGTPPEQDVGALVWYRSYHQRALAAAREAGRDRALLEQALVIDAFGCHFLTDLFATGHMRVPRRLLGERLGIFRGSLGLAHAMHCEDNKLGLWCTTLLAQSPRRVWVAYGDAMLCSPVSELQHLGLVREAVRRSVHEVIAAYQGTSLPPAEQAEALVPVPLRPGEAPTEHDVLPQSPMLPTLTLFPDLGANHYPMIVYLPKLDLLVKRVGTADVNVYSDLKDRLPECFDVDFSGAVPEMGAERIPRLT